MLLLARKLASTPTAIINNLNFNVRNPVRKLTGIQSIISETNRIHDVSSQETNRNT